MSINPNLYTPTQRKNGGLKRYQTAKIHPVYKIFLPNNVDMDHDNLFPSCYRHGQAGGQARAKTGKRNQLGQYIKGD